MLLGKIIMQLVLVMVIAWFVMVNPLNWEILQPINQLVEEVVQKHQDNYEKTVFLVPPSPETEKKLKEKKALERANECKQYHIGNLQKKISALSTQYSSDLQNSQTEVNAVKELLNSTEPCTADLIQTYNTQAINLKNQIIQFDGLLKEAEVVYKCLCQVYGEKHQQCQAMNAPGQEENQDVCFNTRDLLDIPKQNLVSFRGQLIDFFSSYQDTCKKLDERNKLCHSDYRQDLKKENQCYTGNVLTTYLTEQDLQGCVLNQQSVKPKPDVCKNAKSTLDFEAFKQHCLTSPK